MWKGGMDVLYILPLQMTRQGNLKKKVKPDKSQYFTKDRGYGSQALEKDKKFTDKLPFVRVIKRSE